MNKTKTNRGFTLVEIAIVLVIIGLLLGGILKGQELINNAKVRAIADRQNSLKVAWFSFIDRFGALPGDYIQAQQYIPGVINGEGNGFLTSKESTLALAHLSSAGYLRCGHCNADGVADISKLKEPTAANSLVNNYGGIMSIWHDGTHYQAIGGPKGVQKLMVHTGPRIPSNILSEVDRKIDDGLPDGGDFIYNRYDPTNPAGFNIVTDEQCTKSGADLKVDGDLTSGSKADDRNHWRPAFATPAVYQNCGAAVTI